jgi:Protein of unknown function (DUF 659)
MTITYMPPYEFSEVMTVCFQHARDFGGDLLEKCYIDIKGNCDVMLNRVLSPFCLVSDEWSNIRNEPVVNYMAASASCTLFLESVTTGSQVHTADWIAADLQRVIETYKDTICGRRDRQHDREQEGMGSA